jgi:hypothetical protein
MTCPNSINPQSTDMLSSNIVSLVYMERKDKLNAVPELRYNDH